MKFIYLFYFYLIFSGCSRPGTVSKDIISKDSLINVIVDMHLGDAILMEPSFQAKQVVINKQEYYSSILKKHSLTNEKFQKNMDYYSQNPEEFEKIYESVIENITRLQGIILLTDSLKTKTVK